VSGPLNLYHGYVNTWECDDVGHMNVQFYLEKLDQALVHLTTHLGAGPRRLEGLKAAWHPVSDHVHFLAELRASEAMTVTGGILRFSESRLHVFALMSGLKTGVPAASLTAVIELRDAQGKPAALPKDVVEAAERAIIERPAYAEPRSAGLTPAPAYSLEDAAEAGYAEIYRGTVTPEHVDALGLMRRRHFIARYSDGGGHFWSHVGMPRTELLEDRLGVAVLENALSYDTRPVVGTPLVVRTAVRWVKAKTVGILHLMFNAETGRRLAASDVTLTLLHLDERCAHAFSPERLAHLERCVVD